MDMKKIMKFAGATCAATGVVALSALVASGAAVGAIVEGFKGAARTMKKVLEEEEQAEETEPGEKTEPEKILSDESEKLRQYVTLVENGRVEGSGTEGLTVESDAENHENVEN